MSESGSERGKTLSKERSSKGSADQEDAEAESAGSQRERLESFQSQPERLESFQSQPKRLESIRSQHDSLNGSVTRMSSIYGALSTPAEEGSDGGDEAEIEESEGSESPGPSEPSEPSEVDVDGDLDEKDFVSGPSMSPECTVPHNILDFQYSFGYDCQLHSNLCVLDPDTVAFVSGNLIHFFRISTREMWFRRSSSGSGLGHIAKNRELPHFAIGEKGRRPRIILYEWPSMKIVALLKRGADRSYTYLNYSSDGELLCSMAGPPDNLFTVWNWRESRIVLRAKSSGQDTFHAAFSSYLPGNITSAGSAHVRFWRMAQTFTGLKLEGAQGRFGNTEVSDVIGVHAMPDGKVVSGCEWGNILIWEAGLIKCEVTKKGRKSCHNAPIAQFEYSNGELFSLGKDGFVKVWYFETIDLADPPDDDRFVEVEPIFELEVVDELGAAALMCMQPKQPGQQDSTWFAQDGGGGFWQLDLSLSADAPAPRRLFTGHATGVAGLASAPRSDFAATLGREGRLHVYSSARRGLVIARNFAANGHALLWLPVEVAACGSVLVLAFGDGVVRVVAVDLAAAEQQHARHGGTALGTAEMVTLLQVYKAHSQAATALALSDDGQVLASGGEDRIVFLFLVSPPQGQFAQLTPIGFVVVEDAVTFLAFKPGQAAKVVVGCCHGQVTEILFPDTPTHDSTVSFLFKEEETPTRTIVYKSVKSRMRREAYLQKAQRRRAKKLAAKKQQLETVKKANPGLQIDEEAFLADSETDEDAEANLESVALGAVRWARYLDDDTVQLAVAGYDAGYLYTYSFGRDDPVECVAVPDDDDLELCSFLYHQKNKYVFLGMGDGSIRCARVVQDNPSDLSDYWSLGMHNGPVTGLAMSGDHRTLYSSGEDGNVFMYSVLKDGADPDAVQLVTPVPMPAAPGVEDLTGDVPTLEDQCAKAEQDRKTRMAAEQLQRAEKALWALAASYNDIVKRNRQLPASQQLTELHGMALDPRITLSGEQQGEADEADMLAFPLEKATVQYRKLADFYTDAVIGHGIRVYATRKKDTFVETIRQRRLPEDFDLACGLVQLRADETLRREKAKLIRMASQRTVEREMTQQDDDQEIVMAPVPVESFLRGINAFEHKFNARFRRLLDKYHSRKHKRELREIEWMQFMRKKPDMNRTEPSDEELIRDAEQTIGDHKLKSDDDYKVPAHQVVTTISKYQQLLEVRRELDTLLGSFNAEVLSLRERKADLQESMAGQVALLKRMHGELPAHLHLEPPEPPTVDEATEYPERQYEISEQEIEVEMDRASHWRRQGRLMKSTVEVSPPAPVDIELEVLRGAEDPVLKLAAQESVSKLVDALVDGGGSLEDARDVRRVDVVDSEEDMSVLRILGEDDAVNTAWEDEMRAQRLVRKVWEQRQLVDDMNQEVDALDDAVVALASRRLEVQRDVALLRHHLLVLHQELVIIKSCEEREEFLAARVVDKEVDCREVLNEINGVQNRLDGRARDVVRCQEREKELQLAFIEAVGDNASVEHLKKIFKKKYKPPKVTNADSSDDSSSSSSSDDDDAEDEGASLDSNELGPARFDDTICPPGCPQELFDLTLNLRAQRHETERDVVEIQKDIEHLRREQEATAKKRRKGEDDLRQRERALEEFRREKQQRLNEVETIVVLRLSQLQHSRAPTQQGHAIQFEMLKNTLVFNTIVLADLDRRKQQLDDEAKAQRAKHKKNRAHLHRMVVDVHYMRERLKILRVLIEDTQYRKFGCIVDMTELEQALLKRFIWDLRSSADEIRAEFHGLIDSIQAEVRAKFEEYKQALEQNTVRQNLLLVLIEERNRLRAAVVRQQTNPELDGEDESPFADDVSQLQTLIRTLQVRRESLLTEAIRLRQKGALPPLLRPFGARATISGPSAYHSVCVAEPIPPPPKPWPPTCITAIKNPMYLGGTPRREAQPTPGSGTARSLAARREAVREQLAAGEDDGVEVRHPQPLQRRSMSLDSMAGPGFLRADMRDIPAIPSEEELMAAGPSTPSRPEGGPEEDDEEHSVEELYRRVTDASTEALGAVEGFLERLSSRDGDGAMMSVEHRRGSDESDDGHVVSDAAPNIPDDDVILGSDSDDGIEVVKRSAPREDVGSTTDEDTLE